MTAPKEIIALVERFERNLEDYRSGKYNETQVLWQIDTLVYKLYGLTEEEIEIVEEECDLIT